MHIKEEPLDTDDYENNLSTSGTNILCLLQSSTNADPWKVEYFYQTC